jgi:signal peptidase II
MGFLLIVFSVVILDQITKFWIITHFSIGDEIPVIAGLFSIRYIRNTGAAFGILSGSNLILIILSIVVLIMLVLFRKQFLGDGRLQRVAASLMMSGIAGNLADRIKYGYVVDFLDFFFRGSHFPAFNVADSAICIGVGLYIMSQVMAGFQHKVNGGVPSSGCSLPGN